MSKESPQFQPGAILHDAIVGAFRSRGLGFEAWCASNGDVDRNAGPGRACAGGMGCSCACMDHVAGF